MLILLDIDGTMLLTRGAGIRAMEAAGRDLFRDDFAFGSIETAGRLDALIWRDLAEANGIDPTPEHHDRFRARYAEHLHRMLQDERAATALPGVAELVAALRRRGGVEVGLLTGNYPETGRLKIAAAGFEPAHFRVAAWGIDGPTRRDLPPVAIARDAAVRGHEVERDMVVVVGDTPYDIDCARHSACRSIGVATGAFDRARLAAEGADLALDDLSDTTAVLAWIDAIEPARPHRS